MPTRFALGFVPAIVLAFSPMVHGQASDVAGQSVAPPQAAAPIVRRDLGGRNGRRRRGEFLRPAPGISVRSDVSHGVQTVSSANAVTELRVADGRAEVLVNHPEDGSEILVDLPGGQVSLIKDGVYTFNADTDTVRVLHGEAVAYRGAGDQSKGAKVKETQQLAFSGGAKLKAADASRNELAEDLIGGPAEGGWRGEGYGRAGYGEGAYGGGFYGGDPYFGDDFGGPFGYEGYGFAPYGFGYPFGIGLGFGYYGRFGGYGGRFGGFRR